LHFAGLVKVLFQTSTIPKVAVHILPEQGHFLKALVGQLGNFFEYGLGIPTAFASAGKRHHTKGAHIVAASCNGYKGGYPVRIQTHRRDVSIGFFFGENHVDRFPTGIDFLDQIGQVFVRIRTNHQVYDLFFFQEFGFQAFCHTAQDPDLHSGVLFLHRLKLFQALAHREFCFFSDGTGIDQNQISGFQLVCGPKTFLGQNRRYDLAVRKIHLAAVALNIKIAGTSLTSGGR